MPIPLPTGSVTPQAANAALEMLRQYPAVWTAAAEAYNRFVPVANLILSNTRDPQIILMVQNVQRQGQLAIDNGPLNIVGPALAWASTRNVLGVSLAGKTMDDYLAGRLSEDQIRALVYGIFTTGAGTSAAVRATNALDQARNAVGMLDRNTAQFAAALGVTPAQAAQIAAGQPVTPAPAAPATPQPAGIVGPMPASYQPSSANTVPAAASSAAPASLLAALLPLVMFFLG